jgi:hypothetical protein
MTKFKTVQRRGTETQRAIGGGERNKEGNQASGSRNERANGKSEGFYLDIWRFVHLAICGEAAFSISGEAGSLSPIFLNFGGESKGEGGSRGNFEFDRAIGAADDFATHGDTRKRDGCRAFRTFAGGGWGCGYWSTHGDGPLEKGVKTTRAREEGPGEPADPVHRRKADGDVSVSDQDPLRGFFGGFGFEGFG